MTDHPPPSAPPAEDLRSRLAALVRQLEELSAELGASDPGRASGWLVRAGRLMERAAAELQIPSRDALGSPAQEPIPPAAGPEVRAPRPGPKW